MNAAFNISNGLDSNKVFLVNRSELEGRLDPVFYRPAIVSFVARVKNGKYPAQPVSHISRRIVDGPFGTQLKVEDYKEEGIPVIRVSNVRTGKISETKLVRISPEKHRQLLRSRVLPNDVILTKAGAILGYSAVFPGHLHEGNITSHLVTITCKSNVNPHYLKYVFQSSVGQKQIYRWGNKSTRPELNTGEVARILVPVPDSKTQDNIVHLMDEAYRKKEQKDAEAQKLLAGIDDYLLLELRIQLPKKKSNDLSVRIFIVYSKKLMGRRIDPASNLLDLTLTSDRYPLVKFSDYVTIDQQPSFRAISADTEVAFLPMEVISDRYGEVIALDRKKISEAKSYTRFQNNDLLWARITPCMENGKSAVVRNLLNGVGLGSTEFLVFRVKNQEFHIDFLHALLRTRLIRNAAILFFTGSSGHQRVSPDFFRQLSIPKPPIEIQKIIVAQIRKNIQRVKQLEKEAEELVEKAKREIEKIILGEAK